MKKILTLVLEGFGISEHSLGNAIKSANMHVFNEFWNTYPHSILSASGQSVGLPEGRVGNGALGNMTISSGRIINWVESINNFFINPEQSTSFLNLISNPDRKIHIMGLCSNNCSHSEINYFISLLQLLVKNHAKNIYFHLITDGKDCSKNSGLEYINQIQSAINACGYGKIATVCGRFYALDRGLNFERTQKYYDLVTKGIGTKIININTALQAYYDKHLSDEFIKPFVLNEDGIISEEDAIVWMNYRWDSSKQFIDALINPKFDRFPTIKYQSIEFYSLLKMSNSIKINALVSQEPIENSLGVYLSKLGLKQARIAESESCDYVKYYFDCGYNGKLENIDKFIVLSSDDLSYEESPEMKSVSLTRKTIDCMEKDYDFILTNFANPDIVAHTGNIDATIKACMAVDICLGKLLESAEENFYTVILISDHGNAETMINDDGSVNTMHSFAKVPFIIGDLKLKLKPEGDLTNVAPTILDYMDIAIPAQMEAESLINKE